MGYYAYQRQWRIEPLRGMSGTNSAEAQVELVLSANSATSVVQVDEHYRNIVKEDSTAREVSK
jgi:hypothetical protein